jgi:MoxR-like ATPase
LKPLVQKERIIELRGVITREVFLHESLAKYIRRLVGATRPYNVESDWLQRSPSELVEKTVDLGASPRATIAWGRLVKVWALLMHERAEVYPEDVQELARYILPHRVWLGPHAASHGVTVDMVIDDIVDKVPVP